MTTFDPVFQLLHSAMANGHWICASSCVPSKNLGQTQNRQSHTGCISLIFLQCAFSNVSSKILDQSRHSHRGYICLTFLHCEFSNVSSNCLPVMNHHVMMHSHIGYICLTFLQCAFSKVSSNGLHEKRHSHIVLYAMVLREVSIGKFTKLSISPFILSLSLSN